MSKAIPEDWSAATLDRFCDVIGGGTPSRGVSEYWCGDIPWASPTEITTRTSKYISSTKESITKLGLEKSSAKILPPGSVLMTSRASIGYVAINTVPMTTNQGFQSLKCKKDSASADYMYQYITWIRPELEKMSAGSTFSEISSASVKRLHVTLPPLPEQQKIASILSSVDNVIEKTRAQIDKLKDLKTGMMQELLTKGIGHTEFKDSPVGRIPVSWTVLQVKDVITKFQNGYAFSASGYVESGVPIVSMGSIGLDGRFNTSYKKTNYWDPTKIEGLNRYLVKDGDLLIAMTDVTPTMELIGRSCIARVYEDHLLNQRVGLIRVDSEKVNKSFLAYYSNHDKWRMYAKGVSGLGAQANIGTAQILDGLIPVPPVEEQQLIVSLLESIDTKVEYKQRAVQQRQKLKKALMQDLLTGKVRVNLTDKESAVV